MQKLQDPSKTKARRTRSASRPRAAARSSRAKFTAKTADPYELYQLSVQSPDSDIAFLRKAFARLRGRKPRHLREDFCGTALLCATWVKQGPEYTAEGFDLDPDPIAWGLVHNIEPLTKAARRVKLHLKDVRAPGHVAADIRVAQNFSYSVFKTRAEMLGYFRAARESLGRDGMFVIDMYGGTEATAVIKEKRKIEEGFTYVWDQAKFLPGTSDYTCYIHFRFRDGTELKRAFKYDWRYWSLSELRDLLQEAGFSKVESYFEQSDDDEEGEGNGEYILDETGRTCQECAGWIAYLVALK